MKKQLLSSLALLALLAALALPSFAANAAPGLAAPAGKGVQGTRAAFGDDLSHATQIVLGRTYQGRIAANDGCDVYTFTVPRDGDIILRGTSAMQGSTGFSLLKSTGEEINTLYTLGQGSIYGRFTVAKGTYYLAVKNYYPEYTGNYSFSVTFTAPDILKAPVISKVENIATGVKLTWNAVSGAKKYRVFYKKGSGKVQALGDTAACTYTWKDSSSPAPASSTAYTFYVRCLDADGEYASDQSAGKGITYLVRPLVAAVNVNSNNKDGLRIVATNYNAGALKNSGATLVFKVREQGVKAWRVVKRMPASQGYSYIWNGAQSGVAYQVNVQAVKGKFESAEYPNGKSIRFYPAPKLLKAEAIKNGVRVTWRQDAKAKSAYYGLMVRSRMSDGSWTDWSCAENVSGAKNSHVITWLRPGNHYKFSVRNQDSHGNAVSGYNTVGIPLYLR